MLSVRRLATEVLQHRSSSAEWMIREHRLRVREDPQLSEMLDLDRLLNVIDSWPEKTPLSKRDHLDYLMVHFGLQRALSAARYAKWVKGSNA